MSEFEPSPHEPHILRHRAPLPPREATGDPKVIRRVSRHVQRHLGRIGFDIHELGSTYVHVDALYVPPSAARPYHTLVTCGMSELPMTLPAGACPCCLRPRAELMVCLPMDWSVEEVCHRPVRWLQDLARLPHMHGTFLAHGHTVPHGHPPAPLAPGTRQCCMLVSRPTLVSNDLPDLGDTRFYALVPLYPEEMELKLKQGSDALFHALDALGVTDVVDLDRPSAVPRRAPASPTGES